MKELTSAEEEIMQVLWEKGPCFVKDVLAELPEPKPAYNTVSTIVRILEKKKFVDYKAYGKTHQYFPLVSKKEYRAFIMRSMVKNYFEDSFGNVLSYFIKEKGITDKDRAEILKIISKLEEK